MKKISILTALCFSFFLSAGHAQALSSQDIKDVFARITVCLSGAADRCILINWIRNQMTSAPKPLPIDGEDFIIVNPHNDLGAGDSDSEGEMDTTEKEAFLEQ